MFIIALLSHSNTIPPGTGEAFLPDWNVPYIVVPFKSVSVSFSVFPFPVI